MPSIYHATIEKTDDGTFILRYFLLRDFSLGFVSGNAEGGRQLEPLQGEHFRHSLQQAACGRFIIARQKTSQLFQTLFSLLRSRHLQAAQIQCLRLSLPASAFSVAPASRPGMRRRVPKCTGNLHGCPCMFQHKIHGTPLGVPPTC
jgi:hypothetical protein